MDEHRPIILGERHPPRRLLTEKEVMQRRTKRTLRPYRRGATKVAKETGKVIFGLGKSIVDGLKYLDEQGQKPRRPHRESPIGLGFGYTKSQRKYQGKVKPVLTPMQRARVEKLKRQKRASRNRSRQMIL